MPGEIPPSSQASACSVISQQVTLKSLESPLPCIYPSGAKVSKSMAVSSVGSAAGSRHSSEDSTEEDRD